MSLVEQNIQCVSIPRSGHHLLINLLFRYYSGDPNFPINDGTSRSWSFKEPVQAGDFYYCEYYKCCQSIPCSKAPANCQKNHDFDLDLEINSSYRYIVQYRHPLSYLVSFYNWRFLHGEIYGKDVKDSKDIWLEFIGRKPSFTGDDCFISCIKNYILWVKQSIGIYPPEKLQYWKSFIKKWIIDNNNSNAYVINYDDLINRPDAILKEVIHFISPSADIDERMINHIINGMEIKNRSDYKTFKYYDQKLFCKFERFVKNEMKLLSI